MDPQIFVTLHLLYLLTSNSDRYQGGSVVSTFALQRWSPGFKSHLRQHLQGVFFICLLASTVNVRTCEGYPGHGDIYHSGFYCPRLSDSQEHMYCCWPGNESLKYCCNQEEFESVMKVNLSEKLATYISRSPLPLLGIGFYGLLILSLMIVDFLYYYRLNKTAFHNMLSHTWIGKHLILPIFQRSLGNDVQQRHKGATARMTADASHDEHRPLEGNV
ncbi:unnamed protein product [Ranitomeya imitator]|uniref:Shisa N-terminal domain-containing protein n=1 Tax=Ranitomeya imitator TaxID=111125 RepID=A0ABN9M3F9_9NEOB|nr:unnamed protein product [Ranitomeya imitator]